MRIKIKTIVCGTIALFLLSACGTGTAQKKTTQKTNPQELKETYEGKNWSQFLGPAGTGVSEETGLLKAWKEKEPSILWQKKIGTGFSAPSVLGKFLVIHHRRNKGNEIVDCFNSATGKPIWSYGYKSNYKDPYGYNDGPRCTPLLTKKYCYTLGAEGVLLCLDITNGGKVWERNTPKEFNIPKHFFGVGCTPVIDGDKLIVLIGGQPNAGVVAFDRKTGKTLWKSVGKAVWDGAVMDAKRKRKYRWTGQEMLVSYSSPLIKTIHGKKHLLCLMRQGLVSLNPQTGEVYFKYWFKSRTHDSVNAARPVVIGDKIFLSAAYNMGSVLLQVKKEGKDYNVLWRNRKNLLAHWSTPIHVDGYIYGFSGRHEKGGELCCINLKTGKREWATTGFNGQLNDLEPDPQTGEIRDKKSKEIIPFPFFGRGSLIRVGKELIILGERGTLALVTINPKKYEEVSRTSYKQIRHPVWTAPVLAHKRLYLRSENHLLCLDVKEKK